MTPNKRSNIGPVEKIEETMINMVEVIVRKLKATIAYNLSVSAREHSSDPGNQEHRPGKLNKSLYKMSQCFDYRGEQDTCAEAGKNKTKRGVMRFTYDHYGEGCIADIGNDCTNIKLHGYLCNNVHKCYGKNSRDISAQFKGPVNCLNTGSARNDGGDELVKGKTNGEHQTDPGRGDKFKREEGNDTGESRYDDFPPRVEEASHVLDDQERGHVAHGYQWDEKMQLEELHNLSGRDNDGDLP
eukprot:9723656-Heterocapsa_arctica.AAC.1